MELKGLAFLCSLVFALVRIQYKSEITCLKLLNLCLYLMIIENFRLRHRGPDWSGLYYHQNCYLAHERLAIVDPTSGDQPLFNEDKTIVVTVGEIFIVIIEILLEASHLHQIFINSECLGFRPVP